MSAVLEKMENVTLNLKANVYFDGGVISHTIFTTNGDRKTVGVIRPGTYHFTTDAPERMDMIGGACRVKFAGQSDWKQINEGETFKVSGKSFFDIAVDKGLAEYLCTFEK